MSKKYTLKMMIEVAHQYAHVLTPIVGWSKRALVLEAIMGVVTDPRNPSDEALQAIWLTPELDDEPQEGGSDGHA